MPPKDANTRKARLYNSRTIRLENKDPSFKDGILLVPDFLESREFEIKSFEMSQLNSKHASSTRVFQSLPRVLRRRAASHNVKRIPKRLRKKALREMKNSVSGVPTKKQHARGRELYRLRMSRKLLKLAARIKTLNSVPKTEVIDKLKLRDKLKHLDAQIKLLQTEEPSSPYKKLNNAVGAYDNTGVGQLAPKPKGNLKYSKRQHQFVWLPSHIWHAKRFHLIKRWGYQIPSRPTQKCYRSTSRASKQGTIIHDTSYYGTMIIECSSHANLIEVFKNITHRKVLDPYLAATKAKTYNGWIYAEDEKIARATVYLHGKKILIRVHPSVYEVLFDSYKTLVREKGQIYDCRYAIGSIELCGPTSLHSLAKVLHLGEDKEVKNNWIKFSRNLDSALIPIGTTFSFRVFDPRYWKHPVSPHVPESDLYTLLSSSPKTINTSSAQALLSSEGRNESYKDQKSIKAIGQEFARINPSTNGLTYTENFPVLVTKLSSTNWTVMLPWFWVLPTWIKLVKVSKVSLGGLQQKHQVNFENSIPDFPHDYPFVQAGWIENEVVGKLKESDYLKLAKGKRTPFDKFEPEGLDCFKCDWTFLSRMRFARIILKDQLKDTVGFAVFDEKTTHRKITSYHDVQMLIKKRKSDYPEEEMTNGTIEEYSSRNEFHRAFVKHEITTKIEEKFPKMPVSLVKLELQEGVLKDNARIYEKIDSPQVRHIVGFVTSGAYNLNAGKATGIGLVCADYVAKQVLVRNVGCSNFYLATVTKL